MNNVFTKIFCLLFSAGAAMIFGVPLFYSIKTGNTGNIATVVIGFLILLLITIAIKKKSVKKNEKESFSFISSSITRPSETASEVSPGVNDSSCAAAMLLVSTILKTIYVLLVHSTPQMDFRRYYDVAEMIVHNVRPETVYFNYGLNYQQFLEAFPFTFGYSAALSMLFRITGVSWQAAVLFNVFCNTVSGYLVYRIGKKLGGGKAGLTALILVCFWPSVFLYTNMIASEGLFTMGLLITILLFISLWEQKELWRKAFLLILIGCILGVDAEIRSMSILLLITFLITMAGIFWDGYCTGRREEKEEEVRQCWRKHGKGPWIRGLCFLMACLLMILPYHCIKNSLDHLNRQWIGPGTADAGSAGGYAFLVGMNSSSDGGFAMEDLEFLFSEMERTGSATEANDLCREAALDRIHNMSLTDGISLFLRKYNRMWGSDDYGAYWNISLMNSDGTLTEAKSALWQILGKLSTVWYLVMAGLAGMYTWSMVRSRKLNLAVIPVILTLGCAAAHSIVEAQERYHYYALYCFAILAALELQESAMAGRCE